MSKIKKAILDASATSFFLQFIALISSMLIARLLTPHEIGTYAISSAIAMILSEFKTLGAGIYLVKEKYVDKIKIRSALGLTLIMSWSLALILFLLGFYISHFYEIENAKFIVWIIAATFLISPYTSIPYSLLTRDLNFKVQRNVKLLSAFSNIVSTIIFIFFDLSYYSIALGYAVSIMTQFFLLNFIYNHPSMEYIPSLQNIRPIFSLGVVTSIGAFLRKSNSLLPDIVIGKLGTPIQVGVFSRGFGFVQFVSHTLRTGIGSVSLSFLSSIKREGGDLAKSYINATYLFNAISLPIFAVASILSLPAIRLLFGNQWDAAAPVASYLMFWAGIKSINFQFTDLVIVVGKSRLLLIRELINFGAMLLVCVFAFPYGLDTIALGFTIIALLECIILIITAKWILDFSVIHYFSCLMKNICIAILCSAPVLLFSKFHPIESFSPLLIATATIFYLPFSITILIFIFKHPIREYIVSILKSVISSRKS